MRRRPKELKVSYQLQVLVPVPLTLPLSSNCGTHQCVAGLVSFPLGTTSPPPLNPFPLPWLPWWAGDPRQANQSTPFPKTVRYCIPPANQSTPFS